MTKADLDEIERAVGFKLPAEYRRVAQEFPFRPIGEDWIYWFYEDPGDVIDETLDPLADGEYDRKGWRAGYLAIGVSAAGDPYVMDTAADGLPILLLSHETHRFEAAWPTFASFVDEWLRAPEEVAHNLAEARAPERKQEERIKRTAIIVGLLILVGIALIWMFVPPSAR